jgi:outer membrane protein TolC
MFSFRSPGLVSLVLLTAFLGSVQKAASTEVVLQGGVQDKNYEGLLSKQDTLVLDLGTALEMARDKNLNLEVQEYSIKEARDRLVGSSAEFLPSVSLIQNINQRDGNFQVFGNQVLPIRQKSVQPRIQSSFSVFQGGRVLFGLVSSNNLLKAEKEKLNDTEQAVLQNTAIAYFSVQRYAAELESELTRLKQAEQNLRERKIALDLGDDIKLSVLQAQQEVEESKARIATVKGQYYSESCKLNALLNLPTDVLVVPVGQVDENSILKWEQQPQLSYLIGMANKNRPDIHIQDYLIKSQRAKQYQTVSNFLPTVQVVSNLSLIGPSYSSLKPDEQLALVVQYDALKNLGGAGISSYLQAKHNKEKLQAELQQIIKDLESSLASLYLNVISGKENLTANSAALKASEESYRQASARLKEGVGTPFELTVAQTALERARANYYDAVVNNKVAQVNFLKGLGIINKKNLTEGIDL